MKTVRVNSNKEIAPGIYSVSFERFFDFTPGQVVKITTGDAVAPRMYSIASGANDDDVQLIYDVKPEGQLTNLLKSLKKGNQLLVSMPFGQFICEGGCGWWVATGTGIAPFYSMMRSGIEKDITLIHGVRNPEHFLFAGEFSRAFGPNYHQCCSGKQPGGTFKGRVTDFLLHQPALPPEARYYLCGSAEMVVDVRDLLIEHHIPFGNICSEIYF